MFLAFRGVKLPQRGDDFWLDAALDHVDCADARSDDLKLEIIRVPASDAAETDSVTELLFGSAEMTTHANALKTYAVLDGAKLPFLMTGILESSGSPYASLFQGETQEEIGEYAPYLVEIERNSYLTCKLLGEASSFGLRENELGIFIRAQVGFSTMRRHLRKYTRVRNERGSWLYWRFWDGRALPAALRAFDPADRMNFFMEGRIRSFLFLAADLTALQISLRGDDAQSLNGAGV